MSAIFRCPLCEGKLDEQRRCPSCGSDFHEEVLLNTRQGELTEGQARQQDDVDNACFDLISRFATGAAWNIEHITIIRNALVKVLSLYGISPYRVYPWLLTPEEGKHAPAPERVIETSRKERLRIKAMLPENVDEGVSDMPVEVVIGHDGIEILAPEVEVGDSNPGYGCPIFVEQANGGLYLRVYGPHNGEPEWTKRWERAFSDKRPVRLSFLYTVRFEGEEISRQKVIDGTDLDNAKSRADQFFRGLLTGKVRRILGDWEHREYEFGDSMSVRITECEALEPAEIVR